MTPISICVIAKNEERHMNNFLSAIRKNMKKYPHEIIVVDTGSTDKTKEIALRYTPRVYDFEWIKDFSAARNYSISLAKYEWILVLDCDEYMVSVDTRLFDAIASQFPKGVGLITLNNICWAGDRQTSYTAQLARIFSKKYHHFEGIVHEQVCAIDGSPLQFVDFPLLVDHHGYGEDKALLREKALRDLELVQQMLQEDPDNPYLYYQLGQSYDMSGQKELAFEAYGKGLSYDLDPSLEYVQLMVHYYGHMMLNMGKEEEALSYEGIYNEFSNSADFVCLMGEIYLKNKMYLEAMKEFTKATTIKQCRIDGSNTYIPLYNIGLINEMMGETESAINLYKNCGEYGPAKRRLELLTN